jgi:hypothetical protein
MFSFRLNPPWSAYAHLLDAGDPIPAASLWIMTQSEGLEARDLELLIGAFLPRRCALWRLATNVRMPENLRETYRAFAAYPELIGEFIVKSQVTYTNLIKSFQFRFAERIYSDVAWLALDQWKRLREFLAESRFGKDSAIALLNNNDAESQAWGNVMLGALWLSVNPALHNNPGLPGASAELILKSLVLLSLVAKAIPMIVCEDANLNKALVFWGDHEELSTVAVKVSSYAVETPETEWKQWIAKGIAFRV